MSSTAFEKRGTLIGCRNAVFALLEEDSSESTTYAAQVMQAPGVIEIALTANTTSEALGADDVETYDILSANNGYDVSVTMASLGTDAIEFLLGSKHDGKGVLVEKSSDVAPYVAMGFITARSDGSDDYVWLYKGKFANGDATFRTKEKGQANWQTPVLTASFGPRLSDSAVRAVVNSKATGFAAIKDTFFTNVYEPQAAQAGA